MELYQQMLGAELMNYFTIQRLVDVEKIMNDRCYQALCRIREVLSDHTLDDRECFMKIEQIVCIFEELGSDGGFRHDFG